MSKGDRMKIRDLVSFAIGKLRGELSQRISIGLYFEVAPASWNSWPLYDTLQEAVEQAEKDDQTETRRRIRRSLEEAKVTPSVKLSDIHSLHRSLKK